MFLQSAKSSSRVSQTNDPIDSAAVTNCNEGYAVGYYSYLTEEKMELFVPVNKRYILNMMGYSIKPKHTASYSAFYQSVSPNSDQRFREDRGHFSDWYFMNTDFLQRGVNMNYYK